MAAPRERANFRLVGAEEDEEQLSPFSSRKKFRVGGELRREDPFFGPGFETLS